MKIRSAVPVNSCLIFLMDGKKRKKTPAQHIRIRLLPEGGCINKANHGHLLIFSIYHEPLFLLQAILKLIGNN